VIAGLAQSSLCAEPYSVAMTVTSFLDQDDASVLVIGIWTRDSRNRVFYTQSELTELDCWNREWEINQDEYLKALARYNNIPRTEDRDPSEDPAKHREMAVREFNARRDAELAPIHERAKARENIYSPVRFEVTAPRDLAVKFDRPKMLNARQVYLLVQPQSCDIALPSPEVSVPPIVSVVRASSLEVDAAILKK
jgi:hypothetical protein